MFHVLFLLLSLAHECASHLHAFIFLLLYYLSFILSFLALLSFVHSRPLLSTPAVSRKSVGDVPQPHRLGLLVEGKQVVTFHLDALEAAFGEPLPPENHITPNLAVPIRSGAHPSRIAHTRVAIDAHNTGGGANVTVNNYDANDRLKNPRKIKLYTFHRGPRRQPRSGASPRGTGARAAG